MIVTTHGTGGLKMPEYVEREAVIDLITRRYENPEICTHEINSIPAADVVPVTRCKDCKYRTEFGHCGHPCQHGFLPTAYPYDFCSYGKHKEKGE